MSYGGTLTDYEVDILRNIDDFGCYAVSVFDPDGEQLPFTYSVGLPISVGQPDVIISGQSTKLMHFMVNEICRQCREEELVLTNMGAIQGLIEGYDCIAREIPASNITSDYFNSAIWAHRHQFGRPMERAFQIVWPGVGQRMFPWDNGCDPAVIYNQLTLYEQEAPQ